MITNRNLEHGIAEHTVRFVDFDLDGLLPAHLGNCKQLN